MIELKYLILLDLEKYSTIFKDIRYLIGVNNGHKYDFSHNYGR